MLDQSDLEVNVLEFRQRSFQFDRLVEHAGRELAVFSRTETESESQFRPRLLHLRVVVPRAWVVYDEPNDVLLLARDGKSVPVRLVEAVSEVGADPSEFQEQGIDWRRVPGPGGVLVYGPEELERELLTPAALAEVLGT
ncbi:MAG TPA: hypothetical protein VEG42_00820 [Thermoplasmata archaeon]|nr:hypothetical protein [Thermoplasmata archaeon]